MKIECQVADIISPQAENTYSPVKGDIFVPTVKKRKEFYDGCQAVIRTVNKANWRCNMLNGHGKGESKLFLPKHVKTWVKQIGSIAVSSEVATPRIGGPSDSTEGDRMEVDASATLPAHPVAATVSDLFGNLNEYE